MKKMEYTEAFLEDQRQFLADLIAFRAPLKELDKRDKIGFVWDDKPEGFYLATLTRQDVISVLQRFLAHDLSKREVYEWAEALDGRESIDRERGFRTIIGHIISAITIDHVVGSPINPERAQALIRELESAQFDPDDD